MQTGKLRSGHSVPNVQGQHLQHMEGCCQKHHEGARKLLQPEHVPDWGEAKEHLDILLWRKDVGEGESQGHIFEDWQQLIKAVRPCVWHRWGLEEGELQQNQDPFPTEGPGRQQDKTSSACDANHAGMSDMNGLICQIMTGPACSPCG